MMMLCARVAHALGVHRWNDFHNGGLGDIFLREMWCLHRQSKRWGLKIGKFTKLARHRTTIYDT